MYALSLLSIGREVKSTQGDLYEHNIADTAHGSKQRASTAFHLTRFLLEITFEQMLWNAYLLLFMMYCSFRL